MSKVKIPDYLKNVLLSFVSGLVFFSAAILIFNLTGLNANTGCIFI